MSSLTPAFTTKRPKWRFTVLAIVQTPQGAKVEVFDDYAFARKWTSSYGGGVVYPRNLVSDYTATSITLKDGMVVAEPEIEEEEHDGYYGA